MLRIGSLFRLSPVRTSNHPIALFTSKAHHKKNFNFTKKKRAVSAALGEKSIEDENKDRFLELVSDKFKDELKDVFDNPDKFRTTAELDSFIDKIEFKSNSRFEDLGKKDMSKLVQEAMSTYHQNDAIANDSKYTFGIDYQSVHRNPWKTIPREKETGEEGNGRDSLATEEEIPDLNLPEVPDLAPVEGEEIDFQAWNKDIANGASGNVRSIYTSDSAEMFSSENADITEGDFENDEEDGVNEMDPDEAENSQISEVIQNSTKQAQYRRVDIVDYFRMHESMERARSSQLLSTDAINFKDRAKAVVEESEATRSLSDEQLIQLLEEKKRSVHAKKQALAKGDASSQAELDKLNAELSSAANALLQRAEHDRNKYLAGLTQGDGMEGIRKKKLLAERRIKAVRYQSNDHEELIQLQSDESQDQSELDSFEMNHMKNKLPRDEEDELGPDGAQALMEQNPIGLQELGTTDEVEIDSGEETEAAYEFGFGMEGMNYDPETWWRNHNFSSRNLDIPGPQTKNHDPRYFHDDISDHKMVKELNPVGFNEESSETPFVGNFPPHRLMSGQIFGIQKTFILDDMSKKAMWMMHLKDASRYNPRRLAKLFNISLARTEGILRLQALEQEMVNQGFIPEPEEANTDESDVGYDTDPDDMMERLFTWDPPTPRIQHASVPIRFVDDHVTVELEDFEARRRQNMLGNHERLALAAEAEYAFTGPLGSQKGVTSFVPKLLHNELGVSARSASVMLMDISDSKNHNYQIAVRDQAGRLREPTPREFSRARREKHNFERFHYIQYQQ